MLKLIAIIFIAITSAASSAATGPVFDAMVLERVSGSESTALAVNDTGEVVVGFASAQGRTQAFSWEAGTVHWLAGDSPHSRAVDVSADGEVIVGSVVDGQGIERAAVWRNRKISFPVPGSGRAEHVSANGRWVAGTRGGEGWLIDEKQRLWSLPGKPAALLKNLVLLESGQQWRPDSTGHASASAIDLNISGIEGSYRAMAAQGQHVLHHKSTVLGHIALLKDGERETNLGTLAANQEIYSLALDLNGDGSRIVGVSENDGHKPTAFLWTPNLGMRGIQEILLNHGIALPGWWLETATAISPDGQHVVGWGINPEGRRNAWRLSLPPLDAVDRDHRSALLGVAAIKVRQPAGVVHLHDQTVVVLEAGTGRLRHFTADGQSKSDLHQSDDWIHAIGMAMSPVHIGILTASGIDLLEIDGTPRCRLPLPDTLSPGDLAYSSQGWLVSDALSGRIVNVQEHTAKLSDVVGNGMDRPGPMIMLPDGPSFVVDQDGRRLQRFGSTGESGAVVARHGSGPGQIARLTFLGRDGDHVFGTDTDNHKIHVWDIQGRLAASWGYPQMLAKHGRGRLAHPTSASMVSNSAVVCSLRASDCRWFERQGITSSTSVPVARWNNSGVTDFGAPLALLTDQLFTAINGGTALARFALSQPPHQLPTVLGWPNSAIAQFSTVADLAVSDQHLIVLDTGDRSLSTFENHATLKLVRKLNLSTAEMTIMRIAANAGGIIGLDPASGKVWRINPQMDQLSLLPHLQRPRGITATRDAFWVVDAMVLRRYSLDGELKDTQAIAKNLPVDGAISLAVLSNHQAIAIHPRNLEVVNLISGQPVTHLQSLDRPMRLTASDHHWAIAEWGKYRYHVFEQNPLDPAEGVNSRWGQKVFSAGSVLHAQP